MDLLRIALLLRVALLLLRVALPLLRVALLLWSPPWARLTKALPAPHRLAAWGDPPPLSVILVFGLAAKATWVLVHLAARVPHCPC